MWDPVTYLRYHDERSRPFHDLVARVRVDQPDTVVDLGCGPGTLTAALAERWPGATVTGLDSSPAMIGKATALGTRASFAVADLRDWHPTPEVDVVVCNAVLQWVPDHASLLARWARAAGPDTWLAVQVPGNFDAPSHRTLRAVAAEPRWRARLAPLMRQAPVLDAADYAALLTSAGCAVDAWETTYLHLLPVRDGADHSVLSWLEGTALRPVRAALGDSEWEAFRGVLGGRLAGEYPARDGVVYFPFRRVFWVARTTARA